METGHFTRRLKLGGFDDEQNAIIRAEVQNYQNYKLLRKFPYSRLVGKLIPETKNPELMKKIRETLKDGVEEANLVKKEKTFPAFKKLTFSLITLGVATDLVKIAAQEKIEEASKSIKSINKIKGFLFNRKNRYSLMENISESVKQNYDRPSPLNLKK